MASSALLRALSEHPEWNQKLAEYLASTEQVPTSEGDYFGNLPLTADDKANNILWRQTTEGYDREQAHNADLIEQSRMRDPQYRMAMEAQKQQSELRKMYVEQERRKMEAQGTLNRLLSGETIQPQGFISTKSGKRFDYRGQEIAPTQENVDTLKMQINPKYKPASESKGDAYVAAERIMKENPNMTFTEAYKTAKRETVSEAGDKSGAREKGKLKAKFDAALPKTRATINSLNTQWKMVDSTIDEAIDAISPFTAGLGAWAKVIPATPQKDLAAKMEMIKANIGFDKLQQMRADSPTGGALGQVSDFENKLLQAVKGSLDQSQTPQQLRKNLINIKLNLENIRNDSNARFKSDYGEEITPKTETHSEMPNAAQYNGKTMTDTETGKKFKSNGVEWLPL